jgi:hypothetical protein
VWWTLLENKLLSWAFLHNYCVCAYRGINGKGREMSSYLCVTLYTLSIYPSAHKPLRRHIPNPFREFPCIYILLKTHV